jgi:hypothetical protein
MNVNFFISLIVRITFVFQWRLTIRLTIKSMLNSYFPLSLKTPITRILSLVEPKAKFVLNSFQMSAIS